MNKFGMFGAAMVCIAMIFVPTYALTVWFFPSHMVAYGIFMLLVGSALLLVAHSAEIEE